MESGIFLYQFHSMPSMLEDEFPRVSICMAGLIADVYSSLDV